jgi:hypothetical protein
VRLRFAIPLTILLIVATSLASGSLPFNAYYILVAVTAIWAAYDSRRLGVERFDSNLALPPIGVLIVLAVFWPIAFPAYLKLRYRIQHGKVGPRASHPSRLVWYIAGGVAVVVGVALFLLWRSPLVRGLASLQADITTEFQVPVNISLRDRFLGVKVVNPPPSADSVRPEWEKSIARFALERYADKNRLDSVSVSLVDSRQQGAITLTQVQDTRTWAVAELQDSAVSRGDDTLARSFIENVRTQNLAGAAQVQPGGSLEWKNVAPLGQHIPKSDRPLVRPVRWAVFVDSAGVSRKLTYSIEDTADTAVAEIWLSDTGGHTYVNTFRLTWSGK